MSVLLRVAYYLSAFIIFWAMVGYPLLLKFLRKIYKERKLVKDFSQTPTVTIMVVAHNEEKVIGSKLNNIINVDYPMDKLEFVVTSDNSTDETNTIVRDFIRSHPDVNMRLFEVENRKGKTNAQNEAQKTVNSDILVMTDANSMLDPAAVRELVAAFSSPEISYVSGRLAIVNADINAIAKSENAYWDGNLRMREIESDIQSITAGNGALYACRNAEYFDFPPIRCHDGVMPIYYALREKKALYNPDAVAYEKAGETIEDEFKRKVRMNRGILYYILPDFRILNIFKYRWFSVFYFGHRTSRYLLWLSHLFVFVSNGFLMTYSPFYVFTFAVQVLFYLLALVRAITRVNNRYLNLIYYYTATIIAQWVGVYNIVTGKAKPFWEKAESTR